MRKEGRKEGLGIDGGHLPQMPHGGSAIEIVMQTFRETSQTIRIP